jgi:hypothetical protein
MTRSSLKIAIGLVAALALVPAILSRAEPSPYLITERRIPPEFQVVAEFLEYLKPANDAVSGFEAGAAPKWDAARLLSFISDDGIAASDVNRGGKVVRYSAQQIRSAVAARQGDAFRMLAHLGHIYAQPYKQYSELAFEPQKSGGIVVRVAAWYRLTFAPQAGQLRLIRIDYLTREGH